jgi:hypothetical protein
MVVTPRELGQPLCRSITDKRFKLVVIGDPTYARNNELLEYTFKCFKSKVEVMPGVFQVQPKNKYIQQEEEQ